MYAYIHDTYIHEYISKIMSFSLLKMKIPTIPTLNSIK